MLCEHCKKKIITERTLWTLFKVETHSLCESCYQRYPLYPQQMIIPIDKAMAHVHVMISRGKRIEPQCYQSFLKIYYLDYLKHGQNTTFIYEDYLDDDLWQTIESLEFGDIYLVTLYENTHEKGEER